MGAKETYAIVVLVILRIYVSKASHFRGGTVSWKHLEKKDNIHKIEIKYRLGLRRDLEEPNCNDTWIQDQTEIYFSTGGTWTFGVPLHTRNNTVQYPPTALICTAYDSLENWAYGYNRFVIEAEAVNPFAISFDGYGWMDGLFAGGGNWMIPALVDVGIRSDTGRVNNPPRTLSSPITRLQLGCPSLIKIRYVDEDGDNVKCRYAQADDDNSPISDECGGVCNAIYPHFLLDESACTIEYDGGGGDYFASVSLMLEDYPRSAITVDGSRNLSTSDYLSQIPLQFIVAINSTSACNVVPTYPAETIADGDIFTVSDSGGTLDEVLYAYPSEASAIIVQFVVLGPVGVRSSSPIYINATGLYASNITWNPDPGQAGRHIICYYAVDSSGKYGKEKCFSVEVKALFNPCLFDNGGCNDVCVPEGPIRTCDCSLNCWRMLDNRKTCAPLMEISCDGLNMDISLPTCTSNTTIVVGSHHEHFTQSRCQSELNGGKHRLNFSRFECGATTWSNPYMLQYGAYLWIWHEEERYPSIITRGEWKRIPVSCSVLASATINGTFVPQLPYDDDIFPEDVSIVGMGAFSFYFEFYYTASFLTAVAPSDYPLQVSVKDTMYFSLGAVGQSGVKFFTKTCTATTTDTDGVSSLSYTFVRDGCYLDPTLTQHSSASIMTDRISMTAFEFDKKLLAGREDAEILIQCEVMLCDASDNSTRCFQGCLPSPSRKKRSATQGISSRFVREAPSDHDDDLTGLRMTQSESPVQTTQTKFILHRDVITEGNGASKISYDWIYIAIAHIYFIMQHLSWN